MRGTPTADGFVARTIWPEDFRVGGAAPAARTLPAGLPPAEALRSLMREEPRGGAQSPYAVSTLWQKAGMPADWTGRPVLALMVNGAQGDDDEAHGGHFALVTGRVQADGQIGDWLVNNFYSLDVESEKGIIAAPVPLDNYLADLNSGQGWYRPSYMVVAVLNDERAAALVQSALNRVYNQFWRHQLVYYHPNENCASISIDVLRALGWNIPRRGPTSRTLAWLGFPFIALKELSVGKAKLAFDYLRTDQTRLMPAAALEEAFATLLAFGQGTTPDGDDLLARMLARGHGCAGLRALSAVSVESRVRRCTRRDHLGIQGADPERSRTRADRAGPAAPVPGGVTRSRPDSAAMAAVRLRCAGLGAADRSRHPIRAVAPLALASGAPPVAAVLLPSSSRFTGLTTGCISILLEL